MVFLKIDALYCIAHIRRSLDISGEFVLKYFAIEKAFAIYEGNYIVNLEISIWKNHFMISKETRENGPYGDI